MTVPPTGTVTFLFTDIEGSTKLWERSPQAMSAALARHDDILREAVEEGDGYVFKTVGDAFCCAFSTAPSALGAALYAQRALFAGGGWPEESGPLRVRMALHAGAAEERAGDYFGPPVNRVARLLSAGHGGQVLLSLAAQELVRDELPEGASLEDLGERRLQDLFRPERVFQLVVPDLPSSFPPLKTLDVRTNNLPAQPTPLVGRERELMEVRATLEREGVRLLTLSGPGGTGKTRLGLQAAAEMLDKFKDGVFFVALAPISDPTLVAFTIAAPLGVIESAERPLEENLEVYLRGKELLLVLDNFEQVVEASSLVGELLAACPKLKVLATSRTLLGVYGEHEYPVAPLALPDPERSLPLEVLSQYEAVRLFIERARATKPGFHVTNQNAPVVAEICVRLDGLPLAIELAAARIKLLPPQKMLQRLASRLKLLKGGARDLPLRQRTLRGAIEWSHELLDEDEKVLFRRLAAFAGGFTLEAAETVCEAEGGLELGLDVLDGVQALVDKSLVRREEGEGDEPRFSMLETIKEYALERLEESGEVEEIRHQHAEYFLALAEEIEPELHGREQLGCLDRLEQEHSNMRAALSFSLERGEANLGLRLGASLGWFWLVRGHLREGLRWLRETLSRGDRAPAPVRAKALLAGGSLALEADLNLSRRLLEESIALYRSSGNVHRSALPLAHLALVDMYEGDHVRARGRSEESLEVIDRATENGWEVASALQLLSIVELDEGKLARAGALLEESEILYREIGDIQGLSASLNQHGLLAMDQGDYQRARVLFEESLELARAIRDKKGEAATQANLGVLTLEEGDREGARPFLRQSLVSLRELGSIVPILICLEDLAAVASARDGERTARLYGAAEALREISGVPIALAERPRHEGHAAMARARVNEAAWRKAWEEGRAMTLDEAVSYALEENVGQHRLD